MSVVFAPALHNAHLTTLFLPLLLLLFFLLTTPPTARGLVVVCPDVMSPLSVGKKEGEEQGRK